MNEFLSKEGIQLKQDVSVLMAKINPTLYEYIETATFPHHLVQEIAKLGIVGADYPVELGGKGLTISDMGGIMYELARRDASVATFFLLHHSLGNYTVLKLAQPTLRDKILKETLPL